MLFHEGCGSHGLSDRRTRRKSRGLKGLQPEAWRSGAPRILPKREALLAGIQGPQGNEENSICRCGANLHVHDGYNALKAHLGMEE